MQVLCTSLQTDNHASTPPLSFYRPGTLRAAQPTASEHWRHNPVYAKCSSNHCRDNGAARSRSAGGVVRYASDDELVLNRADCGTHFSNGLPTLFGVFSATLIFWHLAYFLLVLFFLTNSCIIQHQEGGWAIRTLSLSRVKKITRSSHFCETYNYNKCKKNLTV